MPIPAEVLKRVKLIELNARKKVNNLFAGEYHTVFKGQGMTFSDFREYVPGDDVRAISWLVTARTSKTHVKQFEEERELSVVLVVDVSGSTAFGSGALLKAEVATYLSAILSMSATKNKDQVGLLLFSDRVEHYLPPAKGRNQVMRIIRDIEYTKPISKKSNLTPALSHLNRVLKKRSLIFLISDFLGLPDFSEDLKILARRHEVIALTLEDPWEQQWPSLGLVDFVDQETGETLLIDTGEFEFQKQFEQGREEQLKQRDQILNRANVDRALIPTDSTWDEALFKFLKKRQGRK